MHEIIYCKNCGTETSDNAQFCAKCGAPTRVEINAEATSQKDWLTTVLLCFFLGSFGIHSFYAGRTGYGVGQLLTLGGCGIWTLVDFIMLLCGTYKDAEGLPIRNIR